MNAMLGLIWWEMWSGHVKRMGTGVEQIQFALYREFAFKLQQQETTCFVAVNKLL